MLLKSKMCCLFPYGVAQVVTIKTFLFQTKSFVNFVVDFRGTANLSANFYFSKSIFEKLLSLLRFWLSSFKFSTT